MQCGQAARGGEPTRHLCDRHGALCERIDGIDIDDPTRRGGCRPDDQRQRRSGLRHVGGVTRSSRLPYVSHCYFVLM